MCGIRHAMAWLIPVLCLSVVEVVREARYAVNNK